MRALVLDAPAPVEERPLRACDLEIPVPREHEILVKVSTCGLCHTDLDEIEGRLTPGKSPIVPGHQVVGTVAEHGPAVTRFARGDRVGITWLNSSCGRCGFCRTGRENLCDNAKWTGKDADGGYAQYTIINEDFACRIPPAFSDTQAAPLLCAGVIGYRALRLAELTDGQTIGLFGFGASAHIVIQLLRHKYPNSPVFVFTRGPEHKELAETLGAAWVGSAAESPPQPLDRAIDFTPVGESVRTALLALAKGGRVVVNAIRKTSPVPPLDYARCLWHEKELKSVANVTRRDAEQFLPLAAEIPIRPQVREFGLDQANDALLLLKQARLRAAGVLLCSG